MNFLLRFLTLNLAVLSTITGNMDKVATEHDKIEKSAVFCDQGAIYKEEEVDMSEQATSEEETQEASGDGAMDTACRDVEPNSRECDQGSSYDSGNNGDRGAENPEEAKRDVPVITIDGDTLRPDIADYLQRRLNEHGIGWFFDFAVMIAYQESSFNIYAENVNGRDKGLFQYRIEFYPGLDWTNPYAQIDLFAQQMANRANSGCDVYTMISRHNMSDYGEYNPVYVDQVLQHASSLWR